MPQSKGVRLGEADRETTNDIVTMTSNRESSIQIDDGSIYSQGTQSEQEQLEKMEEKLYMAKLGLHAMTVKMKKRDEELNICKQ